MFSFETISFFVLQVLKAVVAQFDAGELITQREMVSARVNSELTSRAEQFGLILDDISITHLTFGREFTQAVELKQVAQQEAEKARFLVEKAEQIKKASIIAAEGDTEAAELLSQAFSKAGEGEDSQIIETNYGHLADLSFRTAAKYL